MTEPRRLGKYELQRRLAHGGMGEVWKALDTQLQRYVAIKLLRTDLQHDPDFVARFEREAQLIASLRHPNIVQIHDFHILYPPESETTQAYMIMDYVEGQTLADYIRSTSRKGQFPPPSDIIYLFTGTSLAIDYAHRQGMIHRDIKPANILLDQRLPTARPMGEPILTDFGIARLQGVSSATVLGSLLGTPLYISPEQARGEHSDQRSDLYSLGVILYEMATGVTPFRGDTTVAILMQHLHALPTPPALINPQISLMLSGVILKSIAKQPDDRFQSAAAMTVALAEAFHLPVPKAFLETPPRPSSPAPLTPFFGFNRDTPAVETRGSRQIPVSSGRTNLVTPGSIAGSPAATPQGIYNQAGNPPAQRQGGTQPFSLPGTPSSSQLPASIAPGQQYPPHTAPRPWFQGKRRAIIFAALFIVVLLISGAGALAIFSPTTPNSTNVVVGQVHFSSSPQAQAGNYDQVQIDLSNVPPPPPGKVYYAWIESVSSEIDRPHWKLPFANGTIHATGLTYPGYKNLLLPDRILLITTEDANMPPTVPYTDPSARRYYATINQTSSATFNVIQCPSSGNTNICLQ